ncbi:hypothetical protein [Chlorogloeopsis sp. ULAP02]|uniref:hypothetical protein n=1 Tax=Chlorogloeopsis sp. ULAP02 TaxID=3107926 RepID=UPI0031368D7B
MKGNRVFSHYHAEHGDENWQAPPHEEKAEPQLMLSQAGAWERESAALFFQR